MRFGNYIANAATLLSVLCATTVTGLLVRREFRQRSSPRVEMGRRPLNSEVWERLRANGQRFGGTSQGVELVVFGDFECPACKNFAEGALASARARFPNNLAVVYRHWPLPYHKFSRQAAVASECAGRQGRFEAIHDVLFHSQDSIGLLPFWELAQRASVSDSVAFVGCMEGPGEILERLAVDVSEVQSLRSYGTPTIILEGSLFEYIPTEKQLVDLIDSVMASRQ